MQKVIVFSTDTYDIDAISIYTNFGCIYGEEGKTYFDMDKIKETKDMIAPLGSAFKEERNCHAANTTVLNTVAKNNADVQSISKPV